MPKIPFVTFNNGQKFPIFGLGTWKSTTGDVGRAVKDAIDLGYRHIDCAHAYGNEAEVGEAIAAKIGEGAVKREDLYITSKLWHTFHLPELVEAACRTTLKNLGVDYVDLYLIHNPMAYKEHGDIFPKDSEGNIHYSNADYVDTWKEMEKLQQKGLAKSIGISNFNKRQIERVLNVAKIKPVTNQVECHPYLNQNKLKTFCKSHGIVLTAYSPLGTPDRPWAQPDEPVLLNDPKLKELAAKYNKSVAQICLRYQVQRGIIPIPKSVTKSRLQENIDIFDFELKPEDFDSINDFEYTKRYCTFHYNLGHPHHPIENDEY